MSLYSVYALVDPLTEEVRYIGSSCNAKSRYASHVSRHDTSNQNKQSWIDELRELNLLPLLVILKNGLEKKRALIRERYWIQIYLEKGARLTNMRDAKLLPWECRTEGMPEE